MTARLCIEPLSATDIEAFVAYRQDPAVARWQSWDPSYSHADALRLIENQPTSELPEEGGWVQLAIRDLTGKVLYGDVAVHAMGEQPDTYEIGVTLASTAQGRGIATEAVERVLRYLFGEAGAHRVAAYCDARNEPVARLLRRVGMRKESSELDADYFKGEWATLDGYAILASERRGEGA